MTCAASFRAALPRQKGLRLALKAKGDLPGARQQYQAALDQRQTRGRALDVAASQASLGEPALEEGHPDRGHIPC
jgi:hypothetical protein